MSNPYSIEDLMHAALEGQKLDAARVLATYADPSNWDQLHMNNRCHWYWKGPMICGYELALIGMKYG